MTRKEYQIDPRKVRDHLSFPVYFRILSISDVSFRVATHTWSLRRVGKLQLLVASCGTPLAWSKLSNGESPQAVLNFLSQVHAQATSSPDRTSPSAFPSYIAYDRACDVLREAVSSSNPRTYQNPLRTPTKRPRKGTPRLPSFLESSRLVVTGFHLQGHSEKDDLCREFCDSAPVDGSAPDLVIPYRSSTPGRSDVRVFVRAFNTSVSQFSSLLRGTQSLSLFLLDYSGSRATQLFPTRVYASLARDEGGQFRLFT